MFIAKGNKWETEPSGKRQLPGNERFRVHRQAERLRTDDVTPVELKFRRH